MLLVLCANGRAAVVARWSSAASEGETVEYYEAFYGEVRGRRPAVILFHNSLDGVHSNLQMRARQLAEKGYYVMAPKLSTAEDFGGVTDAMKLSPAQRAEFMRLNAARAAAALRLARGDGRVQPERVALVGYCHLGGPAAMNLAREGAAVAGVAALWGGVSSKDMPIAWGRRRLKPRILVLLGGKDVETNPYLDSFQEEMRAGGADWRLVVYGKASHAFTLPGPHPDGRGEYDPEADRLSWRELTLFLEDLFKSPV